MDFAFKDFVVAISCFMAGASVAAVYFMARFKSLELAKSRADELEKKVREQSSEVLKAVEEKAVAITESQHMKKRVEDWEQARKESMESAKAAIFEVGNKLSGNLIEQHKRESDATKKEVEQHKQKMSEEFQAVVKIVHSLDEQVQKHSKQSETVWRALTSPQSVGYFGEIGLENTLKNLGLEEGRDFRLQFSITTSDGRFRPDALVFLPKGIVLVVDSKATQIVLELANAEQNGQLDVILPRLKESMNAQLKNFASKEYEKAVREIYREQGRIEELNEIYKIMYVPSESAFSYISKADPDFTHKANLNGIFPASPQNFASLIALAKAKIQEARQIENYKNIMDAVRDFMGRVAVALSYADNIGKALSKAQDNYDSFARSINRKLLPKQKELRKLGLTHTGKTDFPARLQESSASANTIEGESEEVEEVPVLENANKEAA